MNLNLHKYVLLCALSCQTRCININEIGDNRSRRTLGGPLQTVLERAEGADWGQFGVLFAFGAYLSVCFLSFSFRFVSCFYLVLILLALFSFSDFVYFGGRARPPASFELFINSVIIKLFRAFCIFLLVYWLFIVLTTNLIILFMDLLGRYSVFYHKLLRARDGNNKWKVSNAIPSQSR